jgi:hypothetical protein
MYVKKAEQKPERLEYKTNRDEILHQTRSHHGFFIQEIELQDQRIHFASMKSNHIFDGNMEGYLLLQHFIERMKLPDEWDELAIEDIVIAECEQAKGEAAPILDESTEPNITVFVSCSSIEIPIQHTFKLPFGKYEKDTKITYYDPQFEEERFFYLNEICSYDVYEDANIKFDHIEDIQQREEIKSNYLKALESLCPRDKRLAVIKYETPDNAQLRFLMKDYLEAEPIIHKNSSSGISAIFIPPKGTGMNGLQQRECMLQPVEQDFSGELEIELFSRYQLIPEGSFPGSPIVCLEDRNR